MAVHRFMALLRLSTVGGPRRARCSLLGLALVLIVGLWASPVAAQPSLPDFDEEWRWTDYDRGSGFPGGVVEEMTEVGDTLWLRTEDRILWFAGYEWYWAGPGEGLPEGDASSISPAEGEGLLAVVDGRIYSGGAGGFTEVDLPGMDPDGWRVERAVGYEGAVIFTAGNRSEDRVGVFRAGGGAVEDITPPTGFTNRFGLWKTGAGHIRANGAEGLLTLDGNDWRAQGGGRLLDGEVRVLWEDSTAKGMAFLAYPGEARGLSQWDPGATPVPVEEGHINVGHSGAFTSEGIPLVVYETGALRARTENGWESVLLPPTRRDGLRFVYADRRGDLWFGSSRGLHLYRESLTRWSSLTYPFPDPRNRINAILTVGSEEVWMGTSDGLLHFDDASGLTHIRDADGDPLGTVTGLARDSTGAIWVTSGASFLGAYRWDGQWEYFGADKGLQAGNVHDVEVSSDGSVWFLGLGSEFGGQVPPGVFRYQNGEFEQWMDPDQWLGTRTYAFAEGADQIFWFGTVFGLTRWDGGEWTSWGRNAGTGGRTWERVFAVLPDSSGGAWVGAGSGGDVGIGVANPDGTISVIPSSQGAPAGRVKSFARDSAGVVWIGTSRGVVRYQDEQWATLDGSAGLVPNRVWPVAFFRGNVLLGTEGGGLQILDRSEEANPPPQVRLLGPISVQDRTVRVRWRAVAYRGEVHSDQVLTRDRMDGGEWSEWATFRELWTSGSDDLDWGRHRIEIQAKGLLGQVSEPLVAEFTVPYPIHLRPLFYVPVGGLIIALGTLLFLNRRRRVRSAKILKASEQRLRTLVDSAPEALVIYDVDADLFVDANQNALEMFGVTRDQATGASLGSFYPETQPDGRNSDAVVAEFTERAISGEQPRVEFMARTASGDNVPTEVRMVRFPSSSRRLVRISLLDVRAQKESERVQTELEEQLRQAQKLQAVGQLTGGVAHDFNNLLTVIMGNLELLQTIYGTDSEARSLVDGSMEAAERSALLTQRLLAFSRRQTLTPKAVAVEETVKGMADLLARSLGETVEVETQFEPGIWMALADVGQLEHALINLAVNARDAMPGGGTLTIEGANSVVGWEVAATEDVDPGEYVLLSVSDTGEGMEPAVASRVFDPFFTTKEVGKGSGLGLSMVYGFFKQLGGFVRLVTHPGKGTTFKLFLPRAKESGEEREAAPPDLGVPLGNREMILVVEDDPRLLKLTVLLCEGLNYRALAAPDGPSAMAILKSDAHIDLLFTDVVLPLGMTGVDVAEAAQEIRPGLKVAFTSGYADQEILEPARANPDFELLTKPFDRRGLARMLRRVLEA